MRMLVLKISNQEHNMILTPSFYILILCSSLTLTHKVQLRGRVFDYQLQDEWQGRQLSAANDQQVEQALQDQGYNNAAVPQAYDTYNDA